MLTDFAHSRVEQPEQLHKFLEAKIEFVWQIGTTKTDNEDDRPLLVLLARTAEQCAGHWSSDAAAARDGPGVGGFAATRAPGLKMCGRFYE